MLWQPEIISIEKRDVLPSSFHNAAVARGTGPTIFLLEVANIKEVSLKNLLKRLCVWGPIVHHDNLVIGEGLREHRIERSPYAARCVVCRNDDAHRYSAAAF